MIGRSLRGEFSEQVDAAIATLRAGVRYLREVEGVGPIRGAHQITEAEAVNRAQPYRVRKRGIATRVTEGSVRALNFQIRTAGQTGGFERAAREQILIQPRTLIDVPVTALEEDGTIRANDALFVTNNVNNTLFAEISGPTVNRGLYRIRSVEGEQQITVEADFNQQNQPAFTPIQQFFDANSVIEAAGAIPNNVGLVFYDMLEIRGSTSNDGIYQVRSFFENDNDHIQVFGNLVQEPAGAAEVRGLIFLRVREEAFTGPADSGAVLLNGDQEVVGLLAGKVLGIEIGRPDLQGYGFAAPIDVVTNRMGITILTTDNQGEELVVEAAAGENSDLGGTITSSDERAPNRALRLRSEQREAFLRVQQEILKTEDGRRYAELVRRHQREVQTLINTNKRVAVVWHRNGGPVLVQIVLEAVQNPSTSIPDEINGLPLAACLSNILDILAENGSPNLRSDIIQFGTSWMRFAGMSFNEMMHELNHPAYILSNAQP